jgi:phage-related holin
MKYFDLDKIWAYLGAALIGFFEPIYVVLLWMLIFIVADMVSGMYASLKEGKILESSKMQKTVVKTITYSASVILLHGIDTYMLTIMDCGLARIGATIICGDYTVVFGETFQATFDGEAWQI